MNYYAMEQFIKAIEENFIVSCINMQGNITYVSDKLCKVSGYTKEELLNSTYALLKHPDVKQEFIDKFFTAIHNKQTYHAIFKNVDKQGKIFYMDMTSIPICNEQGDVEEVISIAFDVSNTVKLNEELQLSHTKIREINMNLEKAVKSQKEEINKLNEEFQRKSQELLQKTEDNSKIVYQEILNSSMEHLINDIAHHWRQPLNELSIAMFKMKQNIQDKEGFLKVYSESKGMIQNISETIDEFRVMFEDKKNQPDFVSLQEALEKALHIINESIQENNVNVEILSKGDYEILIDKSSLVRVFINIIGNAVEAFVKQKDKNIFIKFTSIYKKYVKISIKDNAGGIESKFLEQIFNPYFTTKHPSQGIGVGLYISKEIIESFGGKIEAKNDEDGMCFEIILQIKEE